MAMVAPLQSSAIIGGGGRQQLMQRFRANTSQLKQKFGQAKSLSLSHGESN
ncbi:GL10772 [Drosophila persimilis]|uniref:GL10772 n=1 Tax=Drosophila persimilis TaxID=7234 RepID=B4GA36_DROPE|nr:GL10772 [Drosophila persimilis]